MLPKLFYFGLFYLTISYPSTLTKDVSIEEEEYEARNFLILLNRESEKDANRAALANWNYASNLTEENLKAQLDVTKEIAKNEKEAWKRVIQFNWHRFSDYSIKRQFQKYSVLGDAALPEDKLTNLSKIISDMEAIYAKAKICPKGHRTDEGGECKLSLEPGNYFLRNL